jgi:hypothetical protein
MAEDTAPAPNTNVTPGAAAAPEVPSAFSLFKPSWEGLKINILEIIMIFLVPTLALFLIGLFISFLIPSDVRVVGLVVLFVIGSLIYAGLVGPALVYTQLKSGRLEKVAYEDAFACSKKFWARFIGLSIVVSVVIFVGFLLLIVPGVIFIRRYFLSQYAMIDQGLGIKDSMHASNELSKGRSGAVFGIIGVDILISIPNVIPVIGGLITFALQIAYFCAPAIRYEQLKKLEPVAKPAA